VNTVTINSDRYDELLHSELMLDALMEYGVDSWEGYEDAMDSIREEE